MGSEMCIRDRFVSIRAGGLRASVDRAVSRTGTIGSAEYADLELRANEATGDGNRKGGA